MDLNFNFEPVYPHHDLLVELARVEMVMEKLNAQNDGQHNAIKPELESRMHNLREALLNLAV